VGIGTTNPLAPLHVTAPAGEVVRIQGINPFISIFDNNDGYRGYLWYRPEALFPLIRSIDVGSASGSGLRSLFHLKRKQPQHFYRMVMLV
jgi:hypothetical protein